MNDDRYSLNDDVKAVLAASRELSPDHDDALAAILVERLGHPGAAYSSVHYPATGPGGPVVPAAITIATGSFLALVGALMMGASLREFLVMWVFVTLMMAAVVQAGLTIARSR